MHEEEEVTPSTSSRKRRYKTSFRFSTMKELKKARVSKKKVVIRSWAALQAVWQGMGYLRLKRRRMERTSREKLSW
jgi:hypothetical protein